MLPIIGGMIVLFIIVAFLAAMDDMVKKAKEKNNDN